MRTGLLLALTAGTALMASGDVVCSFAGKI
jgi:hypothetical protein